ncbi:MAG: hypothetical protein WKF61_05555 [Luteimonas sp.]
MGQLLSKTGPRIAVCIALIGLLSACSGGDSDTLEPSLTNPPPAPALPVKIVETQPPLAVQRFAPDNTAAGVAFNVQADGNSGVFFEINGAAGTDPITVTFDGKPLTGVVVSEKVITATIPGDYLKVAGTFPVELHEGSRTIPAGNFTVK